MDWNKFEQEEDKVIAAGYIKENFFFQTGGGEDENDMSIYVKGNTALMHDYIYDRWFLCSYDRLNYVDGWDEDNQSYFDISNI